MEDKMWYDHVFEFAKNHKVELGCLYAGYLLGNWACYKRLGRYVARAIKKFEIA